MQVGDIIPYTFNEVGLSSTRPALVLSVGEGAATLAVFMAPEDESGSLIEYRQFPPTPVVQSAARPAEETETDAPA